MRKIAYIIPGFKDYSHDRRGYNRIADFFRACGIKPVRIRIDWDKKERIFEQYAAQFLKQYKKPKGARVYIWGFSFGAITALMGAAKAKPDVLILCSLSPYFKDDFKNLRPSYLTWYKKTFKNSAYSFGPLAARVKSGTIIVAGDKEGPEVMRRAKAARRAIKNSSLVIIKGARHKISGGAYQKALERIIAKL